MEGIFRVLICEVLLYKLSRMVGRRRVRNQEVVGLEFTNRIIKFVGVTVVRE